jgi:hypothetical protein
MDAARVTERAPRCLSRRRKLAFTAILFGILLLVLEIALRLIQPQSIALSMARSRSHVQRDWTKADLRPLASERYRYARRDGTLALDFLLATDDRGLRRPDPDRPLAREHDGRPRRLIHCVGDSMTMGWGVMAEESYPARLQQRLGESFLVLNLGVDGFGLRNATERSRRFGAEFPPEVAIVMPYKNDLTEDREDLRRDRRSSWQHGFSRGVGSMRRGLHLMHCVTAARMVLAGRGAIDVPPEMIAEHVGPDMTAATWQVLADGSPLASGPSVEALQAYADEQRSAGRQVLVLFAHANLYAFSLARHCREQGIPYLAVPLGISRHLPADLHLNARGCDELADAVHRALTAGEGVTGPWTPLE